MFLKRKGSLLIIGKEKAVPEPVCWAVCFFYTSTVLPTYKHCASYRQAVCLLGIGVLSRVWRGGGARLMSLLPYTSLCRVKIM